MRQVLRVMENYFSQLDSNTPNHAEKYTADQFIGGSFTGTNITATDVNTTTLEALISTIGYERASGVWTDALISYGHRNGRQVSDDIMVGSVYADYFYGDSTNLHSPYAQLVSNTTQSAAAIDQAYAVTFDVNDFPDGITIVSSSRITFSRAGIYLITPSIQLSSTSTGTEIVNVWFRKNGTDIANSNTKYSIPSRKSAGVPAALVASSPFIISVAANDYIQIMWNPTDITVTIQQSPALTFSAGVCPTIPATPSAFCNIGFVSAKFPTPTYVAPLPVFGFGQIGDISVRTNRR
jgi:hypothetical protein